MSKKTRNQRRKETGRSPGEARQATTDAGPQTRRSRRRLWLGVAGVVVVLSVAAWLTIRSRPADPATLNVLVISLDTTRADSLSCYARSGASTPHIDQLAAEGALFTQCTSVAPSTLPSHASLLTGTYPFTHGARVNGQFSLADENETLAEILKAAGFVTGAQVAAMVLNREFGLNQGFDVYDDPRAVQAEHPTVTGEPVRERSASDICDRAIRFLRTNQERRFFLFLHFFDPHQPLQPPEPFRRRYAQDLYLGEIAYVDQQIGRLLRELQALKLDRRTLVVLTADHGEGRNQHGEENHGLFVYDSTLAIPLILRCPGWIPAATRVDQQVRLIDVAPTVLALVGVAPPHSVPGIDLMPMIRGETSTQLAAYSETLASLYDYGYAPLRSIRQAGWKYVLGPRPELYNVAVDPGEQNNLVETCAQQAEQMRAALQRLVREAGPGVKSERRVGSPEQRRELAGLGYVGLDGSGEADPQAADDLERYPPRGLNPLECAEEIRYVNSCLTLMLAGRYAEAERKLRAFLAEHTGRTEGLYTVHRCLANTLDGMGRVEDSIGFYEKAVAERPDDVITLTDMGIALFRAGRTDDAIAVFRRALDHPLELPYTHLQLGAALVSKGDHAGAEREYLAALEADPNIAAAHAALGSIYAATQRTDQAIAALQRAVQLNPKESSYRRRLAELTGGS